MYANSRSTPPMMTARGSFSMVMTVITSPTRTLFMNSSLSNPNASAAFNPMRWKRFFSSASPSFSVDKSGRMISAGIVLRFFFFCSYRKYE